MSETTWVFGGGGVGAIAWETGMLAGLLDEGVDVDIADPLLGTSAGAVVAAQLAGGTRVEALYERQRGGVPFEVPKGLSWRMLSAMTRDGLLARSAEDFGRRIGRAAVDLGQEEAGIRRRVVEARLPTHDWGSSDVRLVVVDADTGAHRLLSRGDGVSLVDAVMASCAIPLVWPVVPMGDQRYRERATLAEGRHPTVLTMSPEVRRAQGRNPLSLKIVPAVAVAGREQGRRDAALVRAIARP